MIRQQSLMALSITLVGALSQVAPAQFGLPDSVELKADLPYADTDNPRQKLDLILPRERSEDPLPVVAFVHGGGWQGGNKRQAAFFGRKLIESGKFAVVSINYRLTDEAQWPQQIYDCKAAIRWIRGNAEKYNLDSDKLGVWGASAGGHLVAMLGTSGGIKELEGTLGSHTDQSSQVTCVVDYFGPADFLALAPNLMKLTGWPVSKLLGGAVEDNREKASLASPRTHVTKDDPPFLIVQGTEDRLVPFKQSKLLHDSLNEAKVSSTLITIEGGGHGRGFPPQTIDWVQKFFDHHLRDKEIEWQDQTLQAK